MKSDRKKILVVTPALPFPHRGAEQMDRAYGIKQLVRLGYDVRVIAKLSEWQNQELVTNTENELGIKIMGVPYLYSNRNLSFKEKCLKIMKKLLNPLYLDGAAFEYSEPVIKKVLKDELVNWKPDTVWFDYTYLWPLYFMVRKAGIRIVTRSINFEPSHFIEEDGVSIINILKYIPKYISELIVAKLSDVVISINPNEERIYKKIGAKVVLNLPLRSLPLYLNTEMNHTRSSPINVFFMGSTYTVTHNKEALRMVIADIAPKIYQIDPLGFKFHIMGNKFPEEFKVYIKDNVANVGYQEDIDSFLKNMDIAIIPSLFGAGMQQKIFESLARGFPTITSQRGMGGYTFTDGVDVLFAKSVDDFCDKLLLLKDESLRKKISIAAQNTSMKLFLQNTLDQIVLNSLSIQK